MLIICDKAMMISVLSTGSIDDLLYVNTFYIAFVMRGRAVYKKQKKAKQKRAFSSPGDTV
jgi:hypothetical protein